jgi:hypothetical protein
MSNKTKEQSDFTCEVIKVLRSEKLDDNNRMDLMVIRWRRAGAPTLEKRQVWTDKEGVTKFRKAKGLDADDVRFVVENYGEITSLLQGG